MNLVRYVFQDKIVPSRLVLNSERMFYIQVNPNLVVRGVEFYFDGRTQIIQRAVVRNTPHPNCSRGGTLEGSICTNRRFSFEAVSDVCSTLQTYYILKLKQLDRIPLEDIFLYEGTEWKPFQLFESEIRKMLRKSKIKKVLQLKIPSLTPTKFISPNNFLALPPPQMNSPPITTTIKPTTESKLIKISSKITKFLTEKKKDTR
jgi:hypothetical protein